MGDGGEGEGGSRFPCCIMAAIWQGLSGRFWNKKRERLQFMPPSPWVGDRAT